MARLLAGMLGALLLAGCSSNPPPHWAEGGSPLTLGRARYEPTPSSAIDLLPDGRVLVDGDHVWTLDTAGRVYDSGRDPVALLSADGLLEGTDDRKLGGVAPGSAAPPGSKFAWIILGPDGQVTRYSSDGEPTYSGGWRGCEGPVLRACTLVTHLVALREWERRSQQPGNVSIGVGFGIGFGGRRLPARHLQTYVPGSLSQQG